MADLTEQIWQRLCDRCAATPKKHRDKVTRLVMVSRADVVAAVKAALKESNAGSPGGQVGS